MSKTNNLHITDISDRNFFENAPIPLAEFDISRIEKICNRGDIKDLIDFNLLTENSNIRNIRLLKLMRLVRANRKFFELFEVENSKDFYKHYREFYTDSSYNVFLKAIHNFLNHETEYTAETEYLTFKQKKIFVKIKINLIEIEQDIKHLYVFMEDITEEKKILEKLRENEKNLMFLSENVNLIPWRLDFTTKKFIYFGKQSEKILGYPPESWDSFDTWKKRIAPEDREAAANFCLEESVLGRDHIFEYRMIHKDGRLVWIRDFVLLKKENGEVKELIGFLMDISDLMSKNKRLTSFAKIFDESIEEIFVVSVKDFRIILANNAARIATGYSNEELSNLTIMDLFPYHGEEELKNILISVMDGSKSLHIFEANHRGKRQTSFEVEVRVQLIDFEGKKSLLFNVRDLSGFKKQDKEFSDILMKTEYRTNQYWKISQFKDKVTEQLLNWNEDNDQIITLKKYFYHQIKKTDRQISALIESYPSINFKLVKEKYLSNINSVEIVKEELNLSHFEYYIVLLFINLYSNLNIVKNNPKPIDIKVSLYKKIKPEFELYLTSDYLNFANSTEETFSEFNVINKYCSELFSSDFSSSYKNGIVIKYKF